MRVNFRLKRFENSVFLDQLHLVSFINQIVGPPYHAVKVLGQVGDFVPPIYRNFRVEGSFAEPLHLHRQVL
ncbi:hypothetical protein D3C76_1613210 [compost metagenome]